MLENLSYCVFLPNEHPFKTIAFFIIIFYHFINFLRTYTKYICDFIGTDAKMTFNRLNDFPVYNIIIAFYCCYYFEISQVECISRSFKMRIRFLLRFCKKLLQILGKNYYSNILVIGLVSDYFFINIL